MTEQAAILLFVTDRPVLSSLQFSLTIEGYAAIDGDAERADPCIASALIVDQGYRGDGLAALAKMRLIGCGAPAVLLATNPTRQLRTRAALAGAKLIEKPLLADELSSAITWALQTRKAA